MATCRAFYQVFPHLSRTISVRTTEHGGDFSHRDTLYDAIHDYLVQTHILWTPPVPPGAAAAADLCFHKAMQDIMGLWNRPLLDRQERDPQVTLTGMVICRARPDAKSHFTVVQPGEYKWLKICVGFERIFMDSCSGCSLCVMRRRYCVPNCQGFFLLLFCLFK